jgi:hypothetical protein
MTWSPETQMIRKSVYVSRLPFISILDASDKIEPPEIEPQRYMGSVEDHTSTEGCSALSIIWNIIVTHKTLWSGKTKVMSSYGRLDCL